MKLRRYDPFDRGGKNWRIEMAGGTSDGDRAWLNDTIEQWQQEMRL
jgi:hypothetical protein